MKTPIKTPEAFWASLDRTGPAPVHCPELGPCWVWTRSLANGYGTVVLPGVPGNAHRVAYSLTYGPIPDGLWVLHRCDNRPCCRPAHLFLGTRRDNMNDMCAKQRQAAGERHGLRMHPEAAVRGVQHPHARLTEAQVRDIRVRYAAEAITQAALGRVYGVGTMTISRIVRGTRWAHVDVPELEQVPPREPCRATRGELNCNAKLTWALVAEIRAQYRTGQTVPILAAAYHVGRSTMYRIVHEQAWRDAGYRAGLKIRRAQLAAKETR